MGIARRKAGSIVRCPRCAGQVIVPDPGPEARAGSRAAQKRPGTPDAASGHSARPRVVRAKRLREAVRAGPAGAAAGAPVAGAQVAARRAVRAAASRRAAATAEPGFDVERSRLQPCAHA